MAKNCLCHKDTSWTGTWKEIYREYSELFCNFLTEMQWISHSVWYPRLVPPQPLRKSGLSVGDLLKCACFLSASVSLYLSILSLSPSPSPLPQSTHLYDNGKVLITMLLLRTWDSPVIFYSFPNSFFYWDISNLKAKRKSMAHYKVDKHTHCDKALLLYVRVLISHSCNPVCW